jgi:tRNA(fMet)-specific endonuclease VapC
VLENAETVVMPFVVIAELRGGFAYGSRSKQNVHVLEQFLSLPGIISLFPDGGTTLVYAELYKHLKQQSVLIPSNDLWIASLCVQHDLPLYTRDGHFQRLPQITLI